MRFDLGFLERADIANMHRRRATELRKLAEDRTASSSQNELLDEADWRESEARRLDDAVEPTPHSDKAPIRIDEVHHPSDYINPQKNGGG